MCFVCLFCFFGVFVYIFYSFYVEVKRVYLYGKDNIYVIDCLYGSLVSYGIDIDVVNMIVVFNYGSVE